MQDAPLTPEEKIELIRKYFEKHGNAAWEGVEAFRLKHGHLPSESDAPCKECFAERTENIIRVRFLESENARLREAAAGPWKPMDTATKDGTEVLLEWNGGGAYSLGHWDSDLDGSNSGWFVEGIEEPLSDDNFNCFAVVNPPKEGS